MKAALLVTLAVVAAASAEWIDIDWSRVKPIDQFDHYWQRLPAELQFLRHARPAQRIVNGQEAQRIGFVRDGVFVHPSYSATLIRNDIATVRLNSPAVFNERVQPIELPARSDSRTFAGMIGTASGFGRTSDALPGASDVVMYTSNPVMTNAACVSAWNIILVSDQNVCLDATGGRSVCNGDSGGPLTVQDGGESLEIGIASFVSAQGCASGIPSVWVRISFYRDFIEQNSNYVFRA
uniref:Peptidase S1 domain-containing protein n=1 Tax=Anopheles coluzzii TaxID=1518534 RepID=A0A8W7PWY7_ANOCL